MSFLSKLWKGVVRPIAKAVVPGYAAVDAAVSGITRATRGGGSEVGYQQTMLPAVIAGAGAIGRAVVPYAAKRALPVVRGALSKAAKPPALKPKGAIVPARPGIGNRPSARPILEADGGKRKAPPKKKAACCNPCKPARKKAPAKAAKGRKGRSAVPKARGITAAELSAYKRLEPMIAKLSTRSKFSAASSSTTKRARS